MTGEFGTGSGPRTSTPTSNPFAQRPRNIEALQNTYSPPLAFPSNYSGVGPLRTPAPIMRSFDPHDHQRPSIATPSTPSKHQGAHFPTKTAPLDYLKRARPSQLQSAVDHSARNSRPTDKRLPNVFFGGPQKTSPPLSAGNHFPRENAGPSVPFQRQRPSGPLFDDDTQPEPQRIRSPPLLAGNQFPRESVDPSVPFQRQRPPGPLFDDDLQPEPQWTSFPPLFTGNHPSAESAGHFGVLQRPPSGTDFNNHKQSVPQRTRPPPQFPGKYRAGEKPGPSVEPPRPVLSSPVWRQPSMASSNLSKTWFGQSPQNSRRHVSINAQALNKTRDFPIPSANQNIQENSRFSQNASIRPSVSPPGSRATLNDINTLSESGGSEVPHMFSPSTQSMNNGGRVIKANFLAPKRSPPLVSNAQVFQGNSFVQDNSEGPSVSPSGFAKKTYNSNDMCQSPDFGVPRMSPPSLPSKENKRFITKATNSPASKRNRSPPLVPSDQGLQRNFSPQDDSEREMQAKAKRLQRFKVELSQPVESTSDIGSQDSSLNRHSQPMPGKQNTVGTLSAAMDGDFNDTAAPDHEGPKSTTVITGLCPDMCPVSEREERERKGDLDKYERLDGDRNRTNKSLSVKKYNRTAEREAQLIRPMPVLKQTIDYLLYLLDQPYDDKFLGLYNFLWDRMRAIRMDLRMQHLFNVDSITMLEQMIRLHIIAMHELCEYTKGEGFSEGFDAHLNIEQMNKTSVELFQLYDDHRKKGISVPSEKEFRGYYALLKLDKHPGYKVEPAELSHDLSKMTREIRQTQEVLFARDVARACRTGNYIAFFRLARKASYLQACLMHAHFAKLRTQALASLHSGLQSNQGIPVVLIGKWLAMEGEDIESLLEYHGFLIRDFDEPYMVKDGQFLNDDNDFPLKCSELVHVKKAEMISMDVASSTSSFIVEPKEDLIVNGRLEHKSDLFVNHVPVFSTLPVDEVMNDNEVMPSPKSGTKVTSFTKTSSFGRESEKTYQVPHASRSLLDFTPAVSSPKSPQSTAKSTVKSPFGSNFRTSFERNSQVNTEVIQMQVMSATVNQESPRSPRNDSTTEKSMFEMVVEDVVEDNQPTEINYQDIEHEEVDPVYDEEVDPVYDEEVAEAKLKLVFRIWRRYSLRRKELREQRQLATVAALNSLSLGPPIRQSMHQPSSSSMLNIDLFADERYERHRRSWSSLNVSEVVADALSGRSLHSKCICWKMILSSQSQNSDTVANSWLHSKLTPMEKDGEFDLFISSPDLSMWKKWIPDKNGVEPICYLSILKEVEFDNLRETVLGSSAVLFLVSEGSSLETERARLHSLLSSLPSDSRLPLLIIVDSLEENYSSSTKLANYLGLSNIDKSLVSDYSVIFLKKNQEFEDFDGYLSDEELRRGLKWLANHSPLPPDVCLVRTWDLIGAHLSSSMRVLNEKGAYEVEPDHCISAFNEALNQTVANIVNAANANSCSWPCPEIDLIDKTSNEYEMVNLHLPVTGWSSSDRIDQLVSALEGTKLPEFEDDFSWLYRGSNSKEEIQNQKQLLENCLINYLAQTSKMMAFSLATMEARGMIQKCAKLELHSSTYYIVPTWLQIFWRIFNWRLMGLSTGDISTAYVLQHDVSAASGMEKLVVEDKSSPHDLICPTLDEMIDRCTEIEVFRPPSLMVFDDSKPLKHIGTSVMGELRFDEDDISGETNYDKFIDQPPKEMAVEMAVGLKPTVEAGRLSKLLEHCNILQDNIDKKLSIYF